MKFEPSEQLKQELRDIRLRKGEALENLIRTHTPHLFAAALGMGFSESDAEELVQEVFTAFLSAGERFEMRSQLKTYLFGILYNKASEMRRRSRREEAAENIEEIFDKRFDARGMWMTPPRGPEQTVLNQELSEWIERCSENLSLKQRAVFYMKEVEGETTQSVCKVLGISVTHLGVLLFRARNKLRECLEAKMRKSR